MSKPTRGAHAFAVGVRWTGNTGEGTSDYTSYERAHEIFADGKPAIPGSSDPDGLVMHDGVLISCDAGIHPNWPNNDSTTSGWIFRIDFI